jgi:hypothetical protein
MIRKRLKQLVIGGAALGALVLGGSAITGAAAGSTGSSSATTALHATAAVPASVGGATTSAMNHVRDARIGDPDLTDHELYVRHHQRLATLAR